MGVTRIKLLRRSLIGLIALVLLAVAINWVQTWRTRARMVRQTAQILSSEMIRSADSIEYSENENGVTRFRLRAQKLLETRQGKSLLQGIEAFDFNPDGSVRNQIRSRNAEYDREARKARFQHDVRIQVGTGVVLRTENLLYDIPNNIGQTDDGLQFESEQAKGKAKTARYDSSRRILDLKGDLDFILQRPIARPDGTHATENVRVTSDTGYYSEADLLIVFRGRSHLDSDTSSLSGDDIEARFTPDRKRLTSLMSQGHAAYTSKNPADRRTLQGDRIDFRIVDPPGALERIDVFGNARFSSDSDAGRQQLKGGQIHVQMDPERGLPLKIDSSTGVEFVLTRAAESTSVSGNRLESGFVAGSDLLEQVHVWEGARMSTRGAQPGQSDELKADDLRLRFAARDGNSVPQELNAQGSVQWTAAPVTNPAGIQTQAGRKLTAAALVMRYAEAGDTLESGDATGNVVMEGFQPAQSGRNELRRLHADAVHFLFFPHANRLREFTGSGNVRVFYRRPPDPGTDAPGQDIQTSSANIKATFIEQDGSAESVAQWGSFSYQDGTRTATSGRGDYDARKDTLLLRESPRIADTRSTTTGETIEYDQKSKILTVKRRVRSVLGAKSSEGQNTPFGASSTGGSAPSVVTAESMQYWTDDAHARYGGGVQMLSESGQLQADTLDIQDSGEKVEAQGHVSHLTVRRENAPPADGKSPKPAPEEKQSKPVLIRAAQLKYAKRENTIHYSGGVTLESADLRITSESMDAAFDAEGKRIERATARGNLNIRQAGREAKGEQGEYYLTPGKFVVTGTLAEIRDPVRGKSQARRLTFFTSDDRILLENH